jgi:hypothetical protein
MEEKEKSDVPSLHDYRWNVTDLVDVIGLEELTFGHETAVDEVAVRRKGKKSGSSVS